MQPISIVIIMTKKSVLFDLILLLSWQIPEGILIYSTTNFSEDIVLLYTLNNFSSLFIFSSSSKKTFKNST